MPLALRTSLKWPGKDLHHTYCGEEMKVELKLLLLANAMNIDIHRLVMENDQDAK